VNAHFPSLEVLQFLALKRLGAFDGKLILSFHGLDVRAAEKATGFERTLWRYLLRGSDAIVTCSNSLKEQVLAFAPDCRHKVTTIHNGFDSESFNEAKSDPFTLEPELLQSNFILSIGTFEDKKGQDVLINAFASILANVPDIILVIIGCSGPARPGLEGLIKDLHLEGRVRLFQDLPHTHIAAFLEKAVLFCLPSRAEPFGIVLLEAGAFEVAVIASDVGGVPEIIKHGIHGRLIKAGDPVALAAEMINLLNDPAERQRLGANLRQRVIENFTWVRAFGEYSQLFAPSYEVVEWTDVAETDYLAQADLSSTYDDKR